MTIEVDFFPNLLNLISEAFKAGDACIIECRDKKTGDRCKVIAMIQLNDVNRKIEFYPVARLYDSNPMEGVEMVDGGAVLASQIPMEAWVERANEKPCNLSQMN